MKKILLLGSGELGREFTIAAKRFGCDVVAVDRYPNAPAMQVTNKSVVIDMLNKDELLKLIYNEEPDFIVPEIEAISIDALVEAEQNGYNVVPSSSAISFTMQRDKIRNLASSKGIRTAKYQYAYDKDSCINIITEMLQDCSKVVVKPAMSSSGKGQSIVSSVADAGASWDSALENMRGDKPYVIIEEFINFSYEVTLLTTYSNNIMTFCDPILHFQKDGDFKWSSHNQTDFVMDDSCLALMKYYSATVIRSMNTIEGTGNGLYGVEFFIVWDSEHNEYVPIFSELSPRPHDTGMVTLRSQNISEFDLHLRAILDINIPKITNNGGACVTINNGTTSMSFNMIKILMNKGYDVNIFGKKASYHGRRMGIILGDTVRNIHDALK